MVETMVRKMQVAVLQRVFSVMWTDLCTTCAVESKQMWHRGRSRQKFLEDTPINKLMLVCIDGSSQDASKNPTSRRTKHVTCLLAGSPQSHRAMIVDMCTSTGNLGMYGYNEQFARKHHGPCARRTGGAMILCIAGEPLPPPESDAIPSTLSPEAVCPNNRLAQLVEDL